MIQNTEYLQGMPICLPVSRVFYSKKNIKYFFYVLQSIWWFSKKKVIGELQLGSCNPMLFWI